MSRVASRAMPPALCQLHQGANLPWLKRKLSKMAASGSLSKDGLAAMSSTRTMGAVDREREARRRARLEVRRLRQVDRWRGIGHVPGAHRGVAANAWSPDARRPCRGEDRASRPRTRRWCGCRRRAGRLRSGSARSNRWRRKTPGEFRSGHERSRGCCACATTSTRGAPPTGARLRTQAVVCRCIDPRLATLRRRSPRRAPPRGPRRLSRTGWRHRRSCRQAAGLRRRRAPRTTHRSRACLRRSAARRPHRCRRRHRSGGRARQRKRPGCLRCKRERAQVVAAATKPNDKLESVCDLKARPTADPRALVTGSRRSASSARWWPAPAPSAPKPSAPSRPNRLPARLRARRPR
jgi:hypothetical protein